MAGKTSSSWLFTLSLMTLAITPSLSHESVVLWNNEEAEVIPDTDLNGNSTREEYLDVTDLAQGLNHWNFNGMWSKYDLTNLQDEQKLVPENPEREDQAVLICHTLPTGSTLEKKFPALENGTLVLSYYTAARSNFTMIGEAKDVLLPTRKQIFNYTFPHDLAEHNATWVTESFHLPNFTNEFMMIITLAGDSSGLWATDEIEVRGYKPTSSPIVGPGIPEPEGTANPEPDVNSTEPTIANNVTVEANGTTESNNVTIDVNATTIANNITFDNETMGNETDTNFNGTDVDITDDSNATTSDPDIGVPGHPSSLEDNVNKLAGVAQAIWDAFYVFLALFCACLVAIVGLIVRGRCKDDGNPPTAVATYNPRTASYRLDKVYDNPSYDTNAV